MRVAAVILAAGASTRLGSPKQLVELAGEKLLDRAVRVAGVAGCDPVVVVLGSSAAQVQAECQLEQVEVVFNPVWSDGVGSSIRCGVEAVSGRCDAVILLTCDQPAITPEHLCGLIARCSEAPVASSYANRRGVPACFPSGYFSRLAELRGDEGARGMLRSAETLELADGELDVDTLEAYAAAKARFGSIDD